MNRLVVAAAAVLAGWMASGAGAQKRHVDMAVATGPESVVKAEPGVLFNGWGIAPAGVHLGLKSMPLKMALSPDGKFLAAVCGGYDTGLGIVDVASRQVVQWVALPRAWNGVAWARDG